MALLSRRFRRFKLGIALSSSFALLYQTARAALHLRRLNRYFRFLVDACGATGGNRHLTPAVIFLRLRA